MIEPRSQCFAAVTSALTPMKIAAYLIEKIGSTVSGYFHPSLWLSESHGLLVTQGHQRIYMRRAARRQKRDRKSTRLNSSHGYISYAVFCLKKKSSQSNAPD